MQNLNVDRIGSKKTLTKKEEKQISDFIKKYRNELPLDKKGQLNHNSTKNETITT